MTLTVFLLGLYIGIFIWKTLQAREWLWLLISLCVWLYTNALLIQQLPELWFLGATGSFYIPYFYMTLGSLVIFLRRQPMTSDQTLLLLWAYSNLILHLAFLLVLVALSWLYPQGRSISGYYALWTIYLFKPVWWIITQCLLGVVIYYSSRRSVRNEVKFSFADCRMGFYVAIWMVVAYLRVLT